MAIFSVNQNRQFFVVNKKVDATPAAEGEVKIVEIEASDTGSTVDQVTFQHFGKGGLVRTDLIDLDKVCYAAITDATKMQRYPKKAVIELNENVNGGELVQGQDYVLRVQINNYLSPGDASQYIKVGAVHVTKAMVNNKELFFEKLAEVLEKSFSRDNEVQPLLEFKPTAASLEITEVTDQPWRLGILSQDSVNFEVFPSLITFDGDDVIWAKVNDKNFIEVKPDEGATPVNNGRKIADLEYFCSAERGDMFRNMGYPNNIDVKMMVDPSKAYNVLDIHYYYTGDGVQSHKSEKTITFVAEDKSVLETIKAAVLPE